MIDKLRFNISSRRHNFNKADAIVVSIPKSGRTWLRVFLSKYYSDVSEKEFIVRYASKPNPDMQRVYFTHDLWEHRTGRHLWHRFRGKYLIPRRTIGKTKILLLVRDPKDVIVSLYFQLTRRDKIFSGTISEMIRSPKYGIRSMVQVMNAWLREFEGHPSFHLLRYESFKADPISEFRKLLKCLGISVDEIRLERAVEFSSFDKMKQMEKRGAFDDSILMPADLDDSESYKVRRGRIGGYVDYLGQEDINFLNEEISRLSPEFGF